MPFGERDPVASPPLRSAPRGGRAWLAFLAAGAVAAVALLGAGRPTAAAAAAALAVWAALLARLAPLWKARAVTRTGDGVEIHQRRADRLAAVTLGFAPFVGAALLGASEIGWEAVAAALLGYALAAAGAAFLGDERLRVGVSGVERVSRSGRTTTLQWSALARLEREAPTGEESTGGGFVLEGEGMAGGRARPVRIRIPDSLPGLEDLAAIALVRAPERVLAAQPALRQALAELARRADAGAPPMVRR